MLSKLMNRCPARPAALLVFALAIVTLLATPHAVAESTAQPRIVSPISNAARATLSGTRLPLALPANDAGKVPAQTQLSGITMVFNRTPAQQADLDSLIAAQQDTSSPLFHQWLTPDQFGARFGMSPADIAAVQSWLQQQGFTVGSVSHSLDRITFSGTAAQVAASFGAEIRYFATPGGRHFAPASDFSVPAALASVLLNIGNLSDFRPHAHIQRSSIAQPKFTSSQSGNHFMTALDVATVYDINAAYNSGYTGTGQTIVVIGQSAVLSTDISAYQTALGLPVKVPNMTLVPLSGNAEIYSGDESESDLDLEYTSSIARGATVDFIYTGNSSNYDVFNSLQYAVDGGIGTIISSSYGDCEADLGATNYASLNAILAQAATEGQSVISAAGDSGSTDCYGITEDSKATQESLGVDFPASSQYVTGLGGTEFPAADVIAGNNTYFLAAPIADVVTSAISYIPEQVWNDDSSADGISSGGGGVSIFTARPTWQSGVSSVATGFSRLVPDISLDSSPNNAPYAFCTSDTSFWGTGQVSSCTSGLRDFSTQVLTVAGGTSFAAPIFAGMLAIINQGLSKTTGQGVVNPILYTLASNPTTYAGAFHDITSGSNDCLAGSTYCTSTGASEFAATTGYDPASGLGSVDLDKLLLAWPAAIATSTKSFTLVATNLTVSSGSTGTSTITITPAGGYTGTIAWSLTASPALPYACYTLPNSTVTSTTAVTATLTVTASDTNCPVGAAKGSTGNFAKGAIPARPTQHLPVAPVSIATLLVAALLARRSRRLRPILAIALLACAGFALTGCSNTSVTAPVSSTTTTTGGPNAATGTYTVTVTGTDTVTSIITAKTTFTLVVD